MSFLSKLFKTSNNSQIMANALAAQQQQEADARQAELQRQLAEMQAASTNKLADAQTAQAMATQAALNAQRAADEAAARAAQSPGDSEDGRQAAEVRMKRLLGRRGISSMFSRPAGTTGAAPVASHALTGA